MASDSEASCVSDPNFAVICSFLQKFGALCGIPSPDFLELQEMLENSQELSPELIDLHLKLLRRIYKSVSLDRWERVLIRVCHIHCSQDAWELERFGYKNSMLSSKLRILKTLLEMQFDFHQKFKAEVNNLTPDELRTEPIGRDKHGHSYWYQVDDACQLRVYREDPDEETWELVANDREGLVRLISQLGSGNPSLEELALNEEDSNSLEIEKPILDTGQASSSTSNAEAEVDESSGANEDSKDVSSEAQTSPIETPTTESPTTEISTENINVEKEPPITGKLKIKIKSTVATSHNSESPENLTKIEIKSKEESTKLEGIDLSVPQKPAKSVTHKRKKSINDLAANLIMKTRSAIYKNPVQEQEMDLSVKKPQMDPKQFSSLSVPPFEPMSIESALRMSAEFADDEEIEDEEDELLDEDEITLPSHMKQPRLDRPTLLTKKKTYSDEEDEEYSEEIEEPVMLIRGEGSGKDCDTGNFLEDYSEAVEEPVMYFFGVGTGRDCDTGNPGKEEETDNSNNLKDSSSSEVEKNEENSCLKDSSSSEVIKNENSNLKDCNSVSNSASVVKNFEDDSADSKCDSVKELSPKLNKIGTVMIDIKSSEKGQTSDTIQSKRNSRWDIGKPAGETSKKNDFIEIKLCNDSTNISIKHSDVNMLKNESDDVNITNEPQKIDKMDKNETDIEERASDTPVNIQKALISETSEVIDSGKPMFFFGPGCFRSKSPLKSDITDQVNDSQTDKIISISDSVPTCINKADNLVDKEQNTILSPEINVNKENNSKKNKSPTQSLEKIELIKFQNISKNEIESVLPSKSLENIEIDLQKSAESELENLKINEKSITSNSLESTEKYKITEQEIIITGKVNEEKTSGTNIDFESDNISTETDKNNFTNLGIHNEPKIDDILDDTSETLSETLESLSTLIENKSDESEDQITKNDSARIEENSSSNDKTADSNLENPTELSGNETSVAEENISEAENITERIEEVVSEATNHEEITSSTEHSRTTGRIILSTSEKLATVSSSDDNKEINSPIDSSINVETSEISSSVDIEENSENNFLNINEENNLSPVQESAITSEGKTNSEIENDFQISDCNEASISNATGNISSNNQTENTLSVPTDNIDAEMSEMFGDSVVCEENSTCIEESNSSLTETLENDTLLAKSKIEETKTSEIESESCSKNDILNKKSSPVIEIQTKYCEDRQEEINEELDKHKELESMFTENEDSIKNTEEFASNNEETVVKIDILPEPPPIEHKEIETIITEQNSFHLSKENRAIDEAAMEVKIEEETPIIEKSPDELINFAIIGKDEKSAVDEATLKSEDEKIGIDEMESAKLDENIKSDEKGKEENKTPTIICEEVKKINLPDEESETREENDTNIIDEQVITFKSVSTSSEEKKIIETETVIDEERTKEETIIDEEITIGVKIDDEQIMKNETELPEEEESEEIIPSSDEEKDLEAGLNEENVSFINIKEYKLEPPKPNLKTNKELNILNTNFLAKETIENITVQNKQPEEIFNEPQEMETDRLLDEKVGEETKTKQENERIEICNKTPESDDGKEKVAVQGTGKNDEIANKDNTEIINQIEHTEKIEQVIIKESDIIQTSEETIMTDKEVTMDLITGQEQESSRAIKEFEKSENIGTSLKIIQLSEEKAYFNEDAGRTETENLSKVISTKSDKFENTKIETKIEQKPADSTEEKNDMQEQLLPTSIGKEESEKIGIESKIKETFVEKSQENAPETVKIDSKEDSSSEEIPELENKRTDEELEKNVENLPIAIDSIKKLIVSENRETDFTLNKEKITDEAVKEKILETVSPSLETEFKRIKSNEDQTKIVEIPQLSKNTVLKSEEKLEKVVSELNKKANNTKIHDESVAQRKPDELKTNKDVEVVEQKEDEFTIKKNELEKIGQVTKTIKGDLPIENIIINDAIILESNKSHNTEIEISEKNIESKTKSRTPATTIKKVAAKNIRNKTANIVENVAQENIKDRISTTSTETEKITAINIEQKIKTTIEKDIETKIKLGTDSVTIESVVKSQTNTENIEKKIKTTTPNIAENMTTDKDSDVIKINSNIKSDSNLKEIDYVKQSCRILNKAIDASYFDNKPIDSNHVTTENNIEKSALQELIKFTENDEKQRCTEIKENKARLIRVKDINQLISPPAKESLSENKKIDQITIKKPIKEINISTHPPQRENKIIINENLKSDSVFDKIKDKNDQITITRSGKRILKNIQKEIEEKESSDDDIGGDFEQGNDFIDSEEEKNIPEKITNKNNLKGTDTKIQDSGNKIVLKDINDLMKSKPEITIAKVISKPEITIVKVPAKKDPVLKKLETLTEISIKPSPKPIVVAKKTEPKIQEKIPEKIPDKKTPVLMCVDITKLKAKPTVESEPPKPKPQPKIEKKTALRARPQRSIPSPKVLETIGIDNDDSNDVINVPETDPLACTEEDLLRSKNEETKAPALSLATFKLDDTEDTDTPSLIPAPIARALRSRKIAAQPPIIPRKRMNDKVAEEPIEKRIKGRGRGRQTRLNQVTMKVKEVSSSEEEVTEVKPIPVEVKTPLPQRGTNTARRGRAGNLQGRNVPIIKRVANDSPQLSSDAPSETSRTEISASPVEEKTPPSRKKRRVLGLDIDPALIIQPESEKGEEPMTRSSVRQSRRIAQIKIKEEAERRKIEELTHFDPKHEKKKKKNDDKDYKMDKKKNIYKEETEEEEESDEEIESDTKRKHKKKRKHQDLRKLFNMANPWQSSSESSSSNEEEEEEVEEEPSDEEAPALRSDHEFSPESDLENVEVQPLRRARTVKKESDTEDPSDEHACQKCSKADHPEWILLCDKCDCGWHCSCLRPALLVIPEGDWFCPPCQHISLIEALKNQLSEYDKKMNRREMEVRRKQRLEYVGISLANVLSTKEPEGQKLEECEKQNEEVGSEDDSSDSSSGSDSGSSSGDESEPIYQLRQRRQAHSYRFNDYDELINSAIQDELEAGKGAGNQGRGKDIATIVNAEKEEAKTQALFEEQEQKLQEPEIACSPPAVPVYEEKPKEQEVSEESSDEERPSVVPKSMGRKKHRKLNSLDISSEDDAVDDEDFQGTSASEEEDLEDLGSEDSEELEFGKRRGRGGPTRRSTRARILRYDKDFINDDSEDDRPKHKKNRSIWDESESEESDKSWGKIKRSKKQRQYTAPRPGDKKSRKKKRRRNEDSDCEVKHRVKKPKIKYGGLESDDDEFSIRKTRGKKINYIDALGSDSEEEKVRKVKPIESEEEYVANEEDEEIGEAMDVVDKETNSESDSVENRPPVVPKKIIKIIAPSKAGKGRPKVKQDFPTLLSSEAGTQLESERPAGEEAKEETENIPVIAANPENLDEEEVGTMMMENEEYAKKQLELMAKQLAKDKKKKEMETRKQIPFEESAIPVPPRVGPKKRGRKSKAELEAIRLAAAAKEAEAAAYDSESIVPTVISELTNSPPKRRGRGKGKKTLAAEAAAASVPPSPSPIDTIPVAPSVSSLTTPSPTIPNITIPVSNDPPSSNLHGGKLGIAAPPQPFSKNQPAPSVITRMLQAQPISAQTFTANTNSMNQKYFPPGIPPEQAPPRGSPSGQFSPYRQSPPAMGMYPGVRQMAPNAPHRLRSPGPPNMQMFHSTHHSMDPSPSGGGPINIAPTNRDRNSPGNIAKEGLTPPPPPYSRAITVNRFSPNENSPGPSLPPPIRHHMFPQASPPPRAPAPGNFSPYHPPPPPNYHYGAYPPAPSLAAADDALPPTDYQGSPYPEHYNTTESVVHSSEGSNSKPFDEEGSGEFGGLVSYFSSQREDDLDT